MFEQVDRDIGVRSQTVLSPPFDASLRDELSDARIQAAQAAIMAAYKKANVGVTVAGNISQDRDKAIAEIAWTIVEQKVAPKKKKKNTDDEGGFATDAGPSN